MLKFAICQIAPVFLDRAATIAKVVDGIHEAAKQKSSAVAFGESLVPGYPVWLSRTGGARFDNADQKRLHARYLDQGVCIEAGDLDPVRRAARTGEIMVILGVAERPVDRGGHSLYCSRVIIGADGAILSVHRKLMPTYEERLCWGTGDGAGLVTHTLGEFQLGALNCWENWIPLARAALYATGENLHVALWPGAQRLTRDITRFIALEGRSFVVSVSGLLRDEDIPRNTPLRDQISQTGEVLCDGGSCVAGPDGEWLVAPVVGKEELITVELDPQAILEARQNFDSSGHYARPDVLRLQVDRRRQTPVRFVDGPTDIVD